MTETKTEHECEEKTVNRMKLKHSLSLENRGCFVEDKLNVLDRVDSNRRFESVKSKFRFRPGLL